MPRAPYQVPCQKQSGNGAKKPVVKPLTRAEMEQNRKIVERVLEDVLGVTNLKRKG